ncbi:hypothetical protein BGZ57DRAFT_78591 [Hyaloscypha finlandica]|nr:hypothetical protein BGZ57DRAFT_78591 [Hyaloscypha finlandica]
MIGKTRSTAIPTVLFCSSAHGHRKVVIKPLQESGILSRYPSMRIAGCRQHPAIPDDMEELEILPLHNAASGQEKHIDLLSYDGGSEASSAATFDNASVFSNQSTSTSQSSVYDPVGAAEDFIALLRSNIQLHTLFLFAREPIDQQYTEPSYTNY